MNKSFGLRKRAALTISSSRFKSKSQNGVVCSKRNGRKEKKCRNNSSGTKRNEMRCWLEDECEDWSTYPSYPSPCDHNVVCVHTVPYVPSSFPTPYYKIRTPDSKPTSNPFKKYSQSLQLNEQTLSSIMKLASGTANGKTPGAKRIKPYWPLKWDPKPPIRVRGRGRGREIPSTLGRVTIRSGIRMRKCHR